MRAVTTAGERVVVDCPIPRLMTLLTGSTGGELADSDPAGETVHVEIQPGRLPFSREGWTLVGRDSWASGTAVLITNACSSGFDLRAEPSGHVLRVTARYRPSPRTRAANRLLGSRFSMLAAQTLLHYPALWWASVHGRVPLHVSVTSYLDSVTMIAGPGGVGKSTLLCAGLHRGEIATADNICACDGDEAHGLAEPLRVTGVPGVPGRASGYHGRRDLPLPSRAAFLRPDRLVVLHRAPAAPASVAELSATAAARALVAGTYMAGELRRFWPFAATLALATGIGPPHPDVSGVAARFAARLPCLEVGIAEGSPVPIGELLRPAGTR
jgi:hypothetical protein